MYFYSSIKHYIFKRYCLDTLRKKEQLYLQALQTKLLDIYFCLQASSLIVVVESAAPAPRPAPRVQGGPYLT